jgi:hypothetical protein
MKALSEERMKDVCKCESCNFEPLAHFQECPKCHSESYHLTSFVYTPQDTKAGCSPVLTDTSNTMSDAAVDEQKVDYVGMSMSSLTPLEETVIEGAKDG